MEWVHKATNIYTEASVRFFEDSFTIGKTDNNKKVSWQLFIHYDSSFFLPSFHTINWQIPCRG